MKELNLIENAVRLIRQAERDPFVTMCFQKQDGVLVRMGLASEIGKDVKANTLEELIEILEATERSQKDRIKSWLGECF